MEHKGIVVGGLGNTLMSDEGIGIHVLREIMACAECPENAEFVELGSSVMNVVHAIAGRQKAVFLDCAFMDEPAGTMRRFTPDEAISTKILTHLSLHEGDLLGALELSRRLGEYPQNVVIFGIQPKSITPGEHLSSPLQERLTAYTTAVLQELNT
ncbi:hydrogenase maturation protease [Chloroflexota bacterium]